MTLVLTHLSKHGIIHASDSNLTAGDQDAGVGQKTFPVPYLNAGLTVAGSYSVDGISMGRWMNDFILQNQARNNSLATFAYVLRDHLQSQMTTSEKLCGSMVHIAGYSRESGVSHPEFWFIRNVHGMDRNTGTYKDVDDNFEISEDFWARDCPRYNLMQAFLSGHYQLYINGFAPGRIGYVILQESLQKFLSDVWSKPEWKFRPPQTLQETEDLVKMYVTIITTLFKLSDYSARYIGGDVQTFLILTPNDVASSC